MDRLREEAKECDTYLLLVSEPGRGVDPPPLCDPYQGPGLILGQSMGSFIYIRNLMLIRKEKRKGEVEV